MSFDESKTRIQAPRAEAIASLNDRLRVAGIGGAIVTTSGVQALSGFDVAVLMGALRCDVVFSHDNDPHGERDFGNRLVRGPAPMEHRLL